MNNRDDGLTLDVLGKVSFGVPTMRLILNDRDLFADKEYFQRKEILLRVVKQWELLSGEKLAITSVTGAFKACMKRTPESVQFEALGGNGIYRRVPVLADLTVQAAQSLPRTVKSKRDHAKLQNRLHYPIRKFFREAKPNPSLHLKACETSGLTMVPLNEI